MNTATKANNIDLNEKISQNKELVYYVLRHWYPTYVFDEDLFQAGLIGLWKAFINYDESKGKFSSFAVTCIKNEISKEIRNRNTQNASIPTVSLESIYARAGYESTEPDRLIDIIKIEEEGYATTEYEEEKVRKNVDDKTWTMLKKHMAGYSMDEIAKEYGVTRAAISRRLIDARAKIRQNLEKQ